MPQDGQIQGDGKLSRLQEVEPEQQSSTGWRGLVTSQAKTLIAFFITLGILVYHILQPAYPVQLLPQRLNVTFTRPANLHVLVPALDQDVNLCRLMLAAGALGYPSPVLLNLTRFAGQDGDLPKVKGVLEYLKSLDSTAGDDVVVVLDGADSWLQLRAQTLVDRFFAINQHADARISADLGLAARTYKIRQGIVFGAQKYCTPWSENDPPCYAVPESPLPRDIYGAETDQLSEGDKNPRLNYRQRFLDSGVVMGNVRSMRGLYGEALRLREEQPNLGDQQAVFSSLFGRQEVWREVVRQDSLNRTTTAKSLKVPWKSAKPRIQFDPQHLADVRAKAASSEGEKLEFGIGVDYGSEIVFNTAFAEDDATWVTFNNRTKLQQVEKSHNARISKSRLRRIGDDIANSLPPFWTFTTEDLPRSMAWQDVQLFTNIFTGTTPAIIHYQPGGDKRYVQLRSNWPLMWFQKHIRILFDAFIYAPITPVAVGGYDEDTQRQYWPYHLNKGGMYDGARVGGKGGDWITFESICSVDHKELFRDNFGKWKLPANH
ncbi:hypothetical protein LTR15_002884 [Elasticomyces elasticus]|nr:hypothetical protein LTR15_002884 [Elasticomyces elasticus]